MFLVRYLYLRLSSYRQSSHRSYPVIPGLTRIHAPHAEGVYWTPHQVRGDGLGVRYSYHVLYMPLLARHSAVPCVSIAMFLVRYPYLRLSSYRQSSHRSYPVIPGLTRDPYAARVVCTGSRIECGMTGWVCATLAMFSARRYLRVIPSFPACPSRCSVSVIPTSDCHPTAPSVRYVHHRLSASVRALPHLSSPRIHTSQMNSSLLTLSS